jgi:hypothetical protein
MIHLLKRFGMQLINGCGPISIKTLKKINFEKYRARFQNDVKNKKVYVVDRDYWSEHFLFDWFMENFKKLNFEKVFVERSESYMDLKNRMMFYGYPDFLGKRNDKILRVEIECFSSQFKYMHKADYCEVVLCYEINEPIEHLEVHELKRILGYEEIINKSEIIDYMHIKYSDFKRELTKICMREASKIE